MKKRQRKLFSQKLVRKEELIEKELQREGIAQLVANHPCHPLDQK